MAARSSLKLHCSSSLKTIDLRPISVIVEIAAASVTCSRSDSFSLASSKPSPHPYPRNAQSCFISSKLDSTAALGCCYWNFSYWFALNEPDRSFVGGQCPFC